MLPPHFERPIYCRLVSLSTIVKLKLWSSIALVEKDRNTKIKPSTCRKQVYIINLSGDMKWLYGKEMLNHNYFLITLRTFTLYTDCIYSSLLLVKYIFCSPLFLLVKLQVFWHSLTASHICTYDAKM